MLWLFLVRVARWPPVWMGIFCVCCAYLFCELYQFVCLLLSVLVLRAGCGIDCINS